MESIGGWCGGLQDGRVASGGGGGDSVHCRMWCTWVCGGEGVACSE